MERLSRTRPSTPLCLVAVATSAWLVLGVLASPPAQAANGAGTTAPAAPPGRVAQWVSGRIDGLTKLWQRFGIRNRSGTALKEQGRQGHVNASTQANTRANLAAALEANGATAAAAERQARRLVAAGGRARLPELKTTLKEAARELGKVPGADDAAGEAGALQRALDAYVTHVAALGGPDWQALRRGNMYSARVQVANARVQVDKHLENAIGAQDGVRIAEALTAAAKFRQTTEALRMTSWRGAWARTLRPQGKGSPLVDAAQDAFGRDRIWGAIEATRDGWLKSQLEAKFTPGGPQTLDSLMAGISLNYISGTIAPKLEKLGEDYTKAVTGKELAEHYWFGRGLGADRRKMAAVVAETAPRALAAIFRGLLTRGTRLSQAEARLIPPLMLEAISAPSCPRALKKELNTLKDQVLNLQVQSQP